MHTILLTFGLTIGLYGQSDSSVRPINGMQIRENLAKQKVELWNKADTVHFEIQALLEKNPIPKKEYKDYLEKAQRNWKAYAVNHCKIIEAQAAEGAQGGTSFYHSCIIELSKKRIEELEELMLGIESEIEERN